ncbi:ATP-grasp domain-containing protein [Arthrobacter sp. SAFR-044]|uniref:ATP-grasp domain-containing protein n=1 Tax=Arthrobacter sp. SAFR-044 TaxID=3387278 RepID=UPI003F7BB2D4
MILVFGRPDDPPIALLLDALQRRNASYIFIDDRHLAYASLAINLDGGQVDGQLRAAGEDIELSAIGSVYARLLSLVIPTDLDQASHIQTFHALFTQWLDLTPALVVNRPWAMASNASKPYQSQLIAAAGLEVPETLVSNDPKEIEKFRRGAGHIVFKSISGVRSIVAELGNRHLERLPLVRILPTQFQVSIPGTDVRVHVVGSRTFATEISSDADDYRYAARSGTEVQLTEIDLDSGIRDACIRLATSLGLPLCGIDLRRTPSGRWVCFEANPMPAYSYYQEHTGADISGALASLLLDSAHPPTDNSSMVQAIENLANITGTVLAVEEHPRLNGWSMVTIQLETVQPIKGSPEIWNGRVGQAQKVAIRNGLLKAPGRQSAMARAEASALVNLKLRCPAQLTVDGIMCKPYPAEGTFNLGSQTSGRFEL